MDIKEKIRSVRLPKHFYGEKIIPNSVKIEDWSNTFFGVYLSDDGEGNLITAGSKIKAFEKIRPVNGLDEKIVVDVKYISDDGNEITKEVAIERYKLGLDVEERPVFSIKQFESPDYDPVNERFGNSLDSYGDYLLVGGSLDSDSFCENKSGKVILYKNTSNEEFRPIKIFQSPFQSSIEVNYSGNGFLSNEYGDFILDTDIGYICASSSFYQDFYGHAVAIDGNFCAITSPYTKKCLQLCETGSGLVYCYQNNKGGEDNWGIINILEGESPEDGFGYSVSIREDIMAVGAPFYSGSRGAVYIFRKKKYQSENKLYFTPTSSIFSDILLSDPTSSILDGKIDEYKHLKIQNVQSALWFPVNQVCFELISSNIFEPLISNIESFGHKEYVASDATDPFSIFTAFDQVPAYVKEDYTWKLEAKIVGTQEGDTFGGCVSAAKDFVVVGNTNPSGSQRAWIYSCSSSLDPEGYPLFNWSEEETLTNSDGDQVLSIPPEYDNRNAYSGFGTSVSTDGSYICVGAPYDRFINGRTIGACTIYKRGMGRNECGESIFMRYPIKKITPYITAEQNYFFGMKCDLKDSNLIVSSPDTLSNINSVNYVDGKFSISGYSSTGSVDAKAFVYSVKDDDVSLISEVGYQKAQNSPLITYGKDVSVSDSLYFIGGPVYSRAMSSASIEYFYSQSLITNKNNWLSSENTSLSGSVLFYRIDEQNDHVGNVFYDRGQFVITSEQKIYDRFLKNSGSSGFVLSYSSEETSYTSEIILPIGVGEFNRSTNPTAIYGNKILLDINKNGRFDISDLNFILKYINEEFDTEVVEGTSIELESTENKSWWKNDHLLTESEDLIIAEGLVESSPLDIYSDVVVNYIKTYLIDTLVLDINGDGTIDLRDANLLWKYWIGKIDVDSIESNSDDECARRTLTDVLDYINLILGKSVPYTEKKYSNGGIYNVGNGGLIKPDFFEYINSSSVDLTGSYLSTYITSVGLYSGGDLVVAGKLGTPIKNVLEYPINLSIKFNLF